MSATAAMPLTATILKTLFTESNFISIPATEAEFWHLVELPQFRIEFHHKHIVGTMSYATTNHERVVRNLISVLDNRLDADNFEVFGSNRPIFAAECGNIYEPDVHVIQGDLKEYHYGKTKTASQNPALIVEVFSPSTKDFDLSEKLECYKTIPSLKHIIFIEPNKPHVQVYNRTKPADEWQKMDFFQLEQTINVLKTPISLKTIYKKVIFLSGTPSV
jgi:Uma2 family endonuclease